jgi:hypothetical protein
MSADVYRRHAAYCLRRAIKTADSERRSFLRRLAIGWSDLADQAEKNSRNDMAYEPWQQRREA